MKIVIIGAGPAGLSAAYEAARLGADVTVLEKTACVGGLSRTVKHGAYRFDIGPHRFFTRNPEVLNLYTHLLGENAVRVPRLTRIWYRGKFFNYPLTPMNALAGIGAVDAARVLASYALAMIVRRRGSKLKTFEDWVVAHFGRALFEMFFKNYTEKVWGIPCDSLSADWAAQRIKGLSLGKAIMAAAGAKTKAKTLADEFLYPRFGAGQFYEVMAERCGKLGVRIRTCSAARSIERDGMRVVGVWAERNGFVPADCVLSSAPLTETIQAFDPDPPYVVTKSALWLRYRTHIGVHLVLRGNPFPDNWVYVHDPNVKAARIANYRNFSKEMAFGSWTPVTVEYFSTDGDVIGSMKDESLLELAKSDLRALFPNAVAEEGIGLVLRSEKAYPVMEIGHDERMETIRCWLSHVKNFVPIGRGGMFRYNNQDHAIATGLLGARQAMGYEQSDPWNVNIDAEYHEGGKAA